MQYCTLVYGTLRPGGRNYDYFLKGLTVHEENIRLSGFTMYGGATFPYVTKGGNDEIVATMVHIDPDVYDSVLSRLDYLEGREDKNDPYNRYDRILHSFEINGVEYKGWIYVAANQYIGELARSLPVLEDGDWISHMEKSNQFY